MQRALSEPARWIALNAGVEGSVVVAKIATLPAGHGYNAATGEYGDLMAQGIIDPVKVTRSAVQNAASIAGMLLTTETLVVEKPEEEKASAGDGHGHSHALGAPPQRDETRVSPGSSQVKPGFHAVQDRLGACVR